MGSLKIEGGCSAQSPLAKFCAIDYREDDTADFEALPGFHLINRAVESLKECINDGERGCSLKKAGAYLGFRTISYTGLPIVCNLASVVVCALLALLSLPTRLCSDKLNRWCWVKLQGSFGYLTQSFFDLTCDARQLTGLCCCAPESLYLQI